jgi:hypothetical protein
MSPWDSGLYEDDDETPQQMVERWERTHPPRRPKAPVISLQSGAKLAAPAPEPSAPAREPFQWIDMSAWDE